MSQESSVNPYSLQRFALGEFGVKTGMGTNFENFMKICATADLRWNGGDHIANDWRELYILDYGEDNTVFCSFFNHLKIVHGPSNSEWPKEPKHRPVITYEEFIEYNPGLSPENLVRFENDGRLNDDDGGFIV